MLYSVPHEYIKRKVDVRVTDKTIEIFYNNNRIASHRRLYGRKGQYSTITEHMPVSHQQYLEWNGDRFRKWAERIGNSTYQVIDNILTSKRVEQQSYRSCMGLLKLADKYSVERLRRPAKRLFPLRQPPAIKASRTSLILEMTGEIQPIRSNRPHPQLTTMRSQEALITIGGKEL